MHNACIICKTYILREKHLSKIVLNTHKIAAELMENEVVVINLATSIYYSIDSSGAHIWPLIEQGGSPQDITKALIASYTVDEQVAVKDTNEFLQKLCKEEIITIEETDSTVDISHPRLSPKKPYSALQINVYRDMEEMLALDPPMPNLDHLPWKQ